MPSGQQRDEAHPGQADVERPEADLGQLVGPPVLGQEVAQAEQHEADGQHPVDAHHGGVGVVGGQGGADLVVGDDRQVDEEAEHPGAEEVPEPDGDQEHHRPPVRERGRRLRFLPGAELQEAPRLQRQEREGDDLQRREERSEGEDLGRFAVEVQVVGHADDATGAVEDDVEEDHRHGHPLAHHAEQHEQVGDHHRGEQLQEVLDPEVDDDEAPEVGHREAGPGVGQQSDGVEGGQGQGGVEEQPRHVGPVLDPEPAAQAPPQHDDPEGQADGEQDLPEPAEVEVLEALHPEPRPEAAEPAVDPGQLAEQAAGDDDHQGAEQEVGEHVLAPGLLAGRRSSGRGRCRRPGTR